MRKLLRGVARSKMERAGITQINKKRASGKSYFAGHWREYVGAMQPVKQQNRHAHAREART